MCRKTRQMLQRGCFRNRKLTDCNLLKFHCSRWISNNGGLLQMASISICCLILWVIFGALREMLGAFLKLPSTLLKIIPLNRLPVLTLHQTPAVPSPFTVKNTIPRQTMMMGKEAVVKGREVWAGRVSPYSLAETPP
ncbi:hypothetical protein L207DRAFT_605592 [Hyaloscypha variabilis F]|uniref:Uncharacterized protein n=1 Tax=Hyaloscypha variabilis (strain UAMH 11265 / GT02V1 / F) TaxID=1149755 RepID=A0A2J6R5H2_HYAVF|nr:hypothetical protein L207DRAFT_605592 [Hyaloscypha variabilis F]